MWEAGKLWALTDKVGTVLTIVSFFLTVGILLCAESISSSLKNKVRVPEAIFELSGLMTDMRAVLRAWDPAEGESEAGRQELNVLMHQAVAYLQNIRPRLDSLQKNSADEALHTIVRTTGYLWWKQKQYHAFSSSRAWDVHNKLQGFSVHLKTLVKDRSAGGV